MGLDMSANRDKNIDQYRTNELLKLVDQGIEPYQAAKRFEENHRNWLGHFVGADTAELDYALLKGVTRHELESIRKASREHRNHLINDHGLNIENKMGKLRFKSTDLFLEPQLCTNLDDLQKQVRKIDLTGKQPKGQLKPKKVDITASVFQRDAAVVRAELDLADGKCELCDSLSFKTLDGSSYLEVHHVKKLADGGSDQLSNVVALCPNCHRELHYGLKSSELEAMLYTKISRLVRE